MSRNTELGSQLPWPLLPKPPFHVQNFRCWEVEGGNGGYERRQMKRLVLCLIICFLVPMHPRSCKVDSSVSSHRKMKKCYVVIGVLTAALLGLILFLGLFFGLPSDSGDTHIYKKAAVATDAGQCSIIGRYLLIVL